MKNFVANLGLKGITLFVFLILLNPFYKNVFPYADILIITIAAFLCFWYLEEYFCLLREGIQKEIEGNNNSLQIFEGHADKKFDEIQSAFKETYSRLGNTEAALTTKLLEMNNIVDGRFNDVFVTSNETKANINEMHCSLKTRISSVSESLEKTIGVSYQKIEDVQNKFVSDLGDVKSDIAKQFNVVLERDLETKDNLNALQNDVTKQFNVVLERDRETKDNLSALQNDVTKQFNVVLERDLETKDNLSALQNDVTKQFNVVLEKDRETKDNLSSLQNDVILHVNKVGDNGNRLSSELTEKLHDAINAVNKMADEQFATTLSGLKELQALTEKHAANAVKQVSEVKEKQNELIDVLHNTKKEIVLGEENTHKDLGNKIIALNGIIGEKHNIVAKNLLEIDSKFERRFQSAEEKQNAFTKLQKEIQQDNKKNFESINSSTKQQTGEQNNLVKEAIKGIASIGTTVALLKSDLSKALTNVGEDVIKVVNNSKLGLDKVLTEKFEDLTDEITENQNATDNSFTESMNAKAQIAQIMEDLVNNLSEQRVQVDGIDKILHNVEDKVDYQNVQVDNIEKSLQNISGTNSNIEPEIRTETFEDKNEHSLLINTLKDNILQYSELRDNNKIVFASFYENGRIVASKSFDENGKLIAENNFYENGELKERKTYYVKNGKTEVEIEKF